MEEIDHHLRMIELFLLSRKPITVQKWKQFSGEERRVPADKYTVGWNIAELLRIGSFEVAKRVRRREEEWRDGTDRRT